jgi:cystathionine beta-lyase
MGKKTAFCPMAYDRETKRYTLDHAALVAAMADPGCTLLVLCNPNNPTGLTLHEEDLKFIDSLSRKYGIPVFSDEIFAEITLTGEAIMPYGKPAAAESLSITCTSLGKCMSLTGVNHSNVIIPNPELRERYIHQKYADHYGSIDPMLYAGLMRAYTEEGKEWLAELLDVIRENRRIFTIGVENAFPGAKVVPAEGTFVVWVDYSGTGITQEDLSAELEQRMFFGDPGSEYFANDMFYRYSIAVPPALLKKSMDWINK